MCRTKDIFQSTWKDVYFGSSLVSSRQFAKLMTTAAGRLFEEIPFPFRTGLASGDLRLWGLCGGRPWVGRVPLSQVQT